MGQGLSAISSSVARGSCGLAEDGLDPAAEVNGINCIHRLLLGLADGNSKEDRETRNTRSQGCTGQENGARQSRKPAAAAAPKAEKPKKPKLVRDSFTIPKIEYKVLQDSKDRAAALGRPVKKSELLRAGLKALAGMSDTAFVVRAGGSACAQDGASGQELRR